MTETQPFLAFAGTTLVARGPLPEVARAIRERLDAGETRPNYRGHGGPQPPYQQLDVEQGYSWLKSPRWRGQPMEVGPLARVLTLYASGHEQTQEAGQNEGRVHVIHRTGRMGLGTAYVTGFGVALDRGARYIVQMDADFSHAPAYIPQMLGVMLSTDADVVIADGSLVRTLHEGTLRMRIPFGVAYGSDKELVKKAALEAAAEVQYTMANRRGRETDVWLTEFGDSSINFLLLVWVNRQGARRPTRCQSAYLWALETKLTEYGIEIPFPQRDLHLKSGWTPPS